jgi:hypothetical protein
MIGINVIAVGCRETFVTPENNKQREKREPSSRRHDQE